MIFLKQQKNFFSVVQRIKRVLTKQLRQWIQTAVTAVTFTLLMHYLGVFCFFKVTFYKTIFS